VSELRLLVLLPLGPDDPDWNDVLARARRARRRRIALAPALAAAVVAVGIASAYALGHPVIDFGQAPKGSTKVVNDFGRLEVGAPPGMAPGVLPHEARKVTSVRMNGKKRVLWVAPTKGGGFCEEWSHSVGGCRADRHDRFADRIGLDMIGARTASGIGALAGSFFQSTADRLELSYADGSSSEIPFVWVTAPIDAGFFFYPLPDDGRRPTALTLYDSDGNTLQREPIPAPEPPGSGQVGHRLPGYPPLAVPAQAKWAKRQQLFDLHAEDGTHIGLWVAPARGGGHCFWTNQAGGCTPAGGAHGRGSMPPLAVGFQAGGKHVTLCCEVGREVARVEARFEDGDRVQFEPKQGYLIWVIPSRHYRLGHRLDQLVAFDASGGRISSRRFQTNAPALYPCTKPKSYGYGVSMCP
jgi:hypothetical protein